VITAYPLLPSLKESLLDYLLITVCNTLPNDPSAVKLSATRALKPNVEGKELVEALKTANEKILAAINDEGKTGEDFLRTYAEFIEEWCRAHIDDNMVSMFISFYLACLERISIDPQRLYLIASLRSLAQRNSASPSLASAHIRLLRSRLDPTHSGPGAAKILKFARKYTSTISTSAEVWLARLDAENGLSSWEEVKRTWSDARSSAEGTAEDIKRVWLWGLDHYPSDRLEDQLKMHEVRDVVMDLGPKCLIFFFWVRIVLSYCYRRACDQDAVACMKLY
jgi:U3 small nucleolar RNA-associated protein 6